MRAFFSNEDMKNLIVDTFNNNTIDVTLIDADTQEETQSDMVSYLNVKFYTWWEHANSMYQNRQEQGLNVYESWLDSLNLSMKKSYALIEQTDEETISSQDIIGATIKGRITFLASANKVVNLEMYLRYLKSQFTGKPIERTTYDGTKVVGYLTLGVLLYDNAPEQTQLGETIIATINWQWSYMQLAETYDNVALSMSLDNTNFYSIPLTKYTWQNIFTTESVPTANRVDLTGFLAKSISHAVTLAFFAFDKTFVQSLNDLFWRLNAVEIDGVATTTQSVNIPIWLKAVVGTHTYKYKCVLTEFEKVFSNNDFTISSMTLKGWGKVGA